MPMGSIVKVPLSFLFLAICVSSLVLFLNLVYWSYSSFQRISFQFCWISLPIFCFHFQVPCAIRLSHHAWVDLYADWVKLRKNFHCSCQQALQKSYSWMAPCDLSVNSYCGSYEKYSWITQVQMISMPQVNRIKSADGYDCQTFCSLITLCP